MTDHRRAKRSHPTTPDTTTPYGKHQESGRVRMSPRARTRRARREAFEGFWDGFADVLMAVLVVFSVLVIVADMIVRSAQG